MIQTSVNFQFSAYIFSADITLEVLKLGRVTKVKEFFLVLIYMILANFNLFEFSAAILEKGLLRQHYLKTRKHVSVVL